MPNDAKTMQKTQKKKKLWMLWDALGSFVFLQPNTNCQLPDPKRQEATQDLRKSSKRLVGGHIQSHETS